VSLASPTARFLGHTLKARGARARSGSADTVKLPMPSEPDDFAEKYPFGFGWTSSRATRMYMIHHASLEELLNYLHLAPLPDAPPADLDDQR